MGLQNFVFTSQHLDSAGILCREQTHLNVWVHAFKASQWIQTIQVTGIGIGAHGKQEIQLEEKKKRWIFWCSVPESCCIIKSIQLFISYFTKDSPPHPPFPPCAHLLIAIVWGVEERLRPTPTVHTSLCLLPAVGSFPPRLQRARDGRQTTHSALMEMLLAASPPASLPHLPLCH